MPKKKKVEAAPEAPAAPVLSKAQERALLSRTTPLEALVDRFVAECKARPDARAEILRSYLSEFVKLA